MKAQMIVVAAGDGVRLKSDIPKPFVLLRGKPLIIHSLETLSRCRQLESLIVVAHPQYVERMRSLINGYGCQKVKAVVAGGETRRKSVERGMEALDVDAQIVAIHDGARPLVSVEDVDKVVEEAQKHPAAILAVRVKPTIKQVDDETMMVVATLNRQQLWDVQTPQVFQRKILEQAHQKCCCENPTDDSGMVEKSGVPVKVVEGSYRNLKITTGEDLVVAEQLLSACAERRGEES